MVTGSRLINAQAITSNSPLVTCCKWCFLLVCVLSWCYTMGEFWVNKTAIPRRPEMQLRANCKLAWKHKKLPTSSHNQAMRREDITDWDLACGVAICWVCRLVIVLKLLVVMKYKCSIYPIISSGPNMQQEAVSKGQRDRSTKMSCTLVPDGKLEFRSY
jgi:hypothetical protein